MYNKSYKGFNKGFKRSRYSVDRSYRSSAASVAGLRTARIVIAAALVCTIVCAIIFSVKFVSENQPGFIAEQRENLSFEGVDDENSELTLLVNKNYPLESSYVPETEDVGGFAVNKAAAPALRQMMSDAASEGVSLKISSAYIPYAQQDKMYNEKFSEYKSSENLSGVKAQAKAESVVPQAGDSDAQTGLLIRFSTDESGKFGDSLACLWLDINCVKYGFTLRYPPDKTNHTAMKADRAAFRYVGRSNASYMRALDMCMEEYVPFIEN